MSRRRPAATTHRIGPDARLAIAAARFNDPIVSRLLSGAVDRLRELGVDDARVEVFRVPGAFELPLAAKLLIETGRFAGIICLGCVIRGETVHFDLVAGEAARGIQQVSLMTGVPVIFGVLTTENEAQARSRSGGRHGHAGRSAADAAVEMICLAQTLRAGR